MKNVKIIREGEDKGKILLIPLGLGECDKKEYKCLAKGILHEISEINPNHIVFFSTVEAQNSTLKYLKIIYEKEMGQRLNKISNFIKIKSTDDFIEISNKFSRQVNIYSNNEILIDYTSGSKEMIMAATVCAAFSNRTLIFVDFKRDENNSIIIGKEEIKEQKLDELQDNIILGRIVENFNKYRYESVIEQIMNLSLVDNEDEKSEFTVLNFALINETYNSWDKFNHKEALEYFKTGFYDFFPPLKKQLKMNYKALKILNNVKDPLNDYYLLASLVNNARRRYDEGKYDDGIARLYRSMELISQIELNKIGINPSDIDINKIKNISEYTYEKFRSRIVMSSNGKYHTGGLDVNFMLIHHLKSFNEVGNFYYKNHDKIYEILQYRNESILAHGFKVQSEEDFNVFEELVLILAEKLDKNFELYLEETRFPEFP